MSRFGIEEIIRPLSLTRVVSEKDAYLFGDLKSKVEKIADSYKPEDEQAALAEIITALKHVYAGNSDYSCVELYTDKSGSKRGVTHINICHMRRVK